MKVVVAMDSFKGSLTSLEAGNAVKRGILRACPDADVIVLPLADGGEGTIDALAPYINGITKTLCVTGPAGAKISADYIFDPKTNTAYIEMAKAAGLTLLDEKERNPYITTTYGVGELMKDAILNGAQKLVICIGGSATNDGGAGMLQALGAKLLDKDGNDIGFGMDVWLEHFAVTAGFDPYEEGTGAAGGMSFALKNFFNASLKSGADIVLSITGAEPEIRDCNIVITGEGRMDSQTLNGKAPFKVLQLAKKMDKPVYGITGLLGSGYEECLKEGFERIVPLIVPTMDTEEAIKSAEDTAAMLFEDL